MTFATSANSRSVKIKTAFHTVAHKWEDHKRGAMFECQMEGTRMMEKPKHANHFGTEEVQQLGSEHAFNTNVFEKV